MLKKEMITVGAMFVLAPLLAVGSAPETALDGYCPVCLVKADKLVKGSARFQSVHDGKRYLFPGAEQKKTFDADPAAFVPTLGGDCVVCKVEMGKRVAGKPEFHTVHNGRLFLFPSDKQKNMFERNPRKYTEADLGLSGFCPVCLVKKDKLVAGVPEYASVYACRRYLFPGVQTEADV